MCAQSRLLPVLCFSTGCGQVGIDSVFILDYDGPMNQKLSKTQEKTLEFIASHIEKHGYAPTRSEIAKAILKNPKNPSGSGHSIVRNLIAKGALKHKKTWRGISLPKSRVRTH